MFDYSDSMAITQADIALNNESIITKNSIHPTFRIHPVSNAYDSRVRVD